MVKAVLISILLFSADHFYAQGSFAPQVGESGSTAIPADSSVFRDWAISCSIERGYRNISLPDSGRVTAGAAIYAVGKSDYPAVVSLGDSGVATLQFSAGIYDGEGVDFAVFENGFGAGADAFLELAFVEVSSDGEKFIRFPSTSEIPFEDQKESFENTDARLIKNLAGKYIAGYGTPFDLADLADTAVLDKSNVTHVRIVDVVGSINPAYGSVDSAGMVVNDPWPTQFASGGFDLDAVGVIHSLIPLGVKNASDSRGLSNESVLSFDVLGRPMQANGESFQIEVYSNGQKVVQMP